MRGIEHLIVHIFPHRVFLLVAMVIGTCGLTADATWVCDVAIIAISATLDDDTMVDKAVLISRRPSAELSLCDQPNFGEHRIGEFSGHGDRHKPLETRAVG